MIELSNEDVSAYIEYLKATNNMEKMASLCQTLATKKESNPNNMVGRISKTKKGLKSPLGASWLDKGMPKGSKWQDKNTQVVVEISDHTVYKGGIVWSAFGDKYFTPDVKEHMKKSNSFSNIENLGSDTSKNSFTAKNWVCVEEGVPPAGCSTKYFAKKGDTIRDICRANGYNVA